MSAAEPPMDGFQASVYVGEILRQCGHALAAIRQAFWALEQRQDAARREAPDFERITAMHMEVFRNLHSFLTHASNVSRMLWPPRGAGEARGRYLRDLL